MKNKHIKFDWDKKELILLDQRKLPLEISFLIIKNYRETIEAIKNMTVRGAPAIGIAAAYACVLAALEILSAPEQIKALKQAFGMIEQARPTAVNLKWAVRQMSAQLSESQSPQQNIKKLLATAIAIHEKDIEICRKIGKVGASLLKNGDTVLTHCNAGELATGGYGTALGVIRAAIEEGKKVNVIADETRPLLQGSRLTAWELARDNIPVKIACDNSCALLMQKKMINVVITGADRIAKNGDAANKIGTFGVAILAQFFNIPFYIAAPLSTIDTEITDGRQIPIEERHSREATFIGNTKIAPETVDAYNFAFDVTPAKLITGIITEKGILYPPYTTSITNVFEGN